jgi:SLIDE
MQYGYGQWGAIKMGIRRSPKFRFDYFLRSLPVELIARRCEHLMRAALKEVEHLEKTARIDAGLPFEVGEGEQLPPIVLPKFNEMRKQMREKKAEERAKERRVLQQKVEEIQSQMQAIQDRLKELNKAPDDQRENHSRNGDSPRKRRSSTDANTTAGTVASASEAESANFDETKGALGPDGNFVEFPEYDGSEPPKDAKKAFALFCNSTRKDVKAALDPHERKDKDKVNEMLRKRFVALNDEERQIWRMWATWDKKRYSRALFIYESAHAQAKASGDDDDKAIVEEIEGPKKRQAEDRLNHVPKKKKR